MTDFVKPSPETFQFLVRLSDIAKVRVSNFTSHKSTALLPHNISSQLHNILPSQQIDLNDVAKVMGSKYKTAWDGFNRAKKDLAAAGYVAPVPDRSASPVVQKKKRAPAKKKTATTKPVEEEVKDDTAVEDGTSTEAEDSDAAEDGASAEGKQEDSEDDDEEA